MNTLGLNHAWWMTEVMEQGDPMRDTEVVQTYHKTIVEEEIIKVNHLGGDLKKQVSICPIVKLRLN